MIMKWERKWERALLPIAQHCSSSLTTATSELGKRRTLQVAVSVLHSWGSRGRGFKSRRPDGFLEQLYDKYSSEVQQRHR